MDFEPSVFDFLKGNSFSNGLQVTISGREGSIPQRLEMIEAKVRNSNVIHVGCADHKALIKEKVKNNSWLHKRLVDSTSRCIGLDINKEAIDYVRNELGYSDIFQHNIVADPPLEELLHHNWDYMVLGEILEHTDNPVLFLSSLREKYSSVVRKLIISVPNAFDIVNFKSGLKHKEFVNSDHRYWFTPYTLAKVVTTAGLLVEDFSFCQSVVPHRRSLSHLFLRRYPSFRETILLTAAYA